MKISRNAAMKNAHKIPARFEQKMPKSSGAPWRMNLELKEALTE